MDSGEDEREEEEVREEREMREERDLRWAPTCSRWDVVPAVVREGPNIVRERTDILGVYSAKEFREVYRFDKETFLRIVDILKDDFPTGRGAISPEKRVGIFLSYVGGNEHQVPDLLALYLFVRIYGSTSQLYTVYHVMYFLRDRMDLFVTMNR